MPGLPTDTVLAGRYRLGDLLGRGGMAEVYDAVDERLERPVAVKVLRPAMAANPRVRTRFEAEARSAACLSHPNVVAVFDTGEDAGLPFLVMERLPGETLADRLAGGPVDVEWALGVAGEVLTGLHAAHTAGLVHRDVKPGNVLIAPDGRAKVADFGIAKSLDVAGTVDLTDADQVIGTPAYLAPERIAGQPATVRSDLYAVGVMLYEALAGAKPFAGPTAVAVAYAVRHHDPEPLARRRPDVDPKVAAAVGRAMAREPDDRFATAGEMAAALGVTLRPVVTSAAVRPAASATADPQATDADVTVADATDVLPLPPLTAPPAAGPGPAAGLATRLAATTVHQRRLGLAAVAALVVLLLGLSLASSAGPGRPRDPRDGLAAELRAAAADLGATDGPAAEDARAHLDDVAAALEAGGGAREASALLGRLAEWRDGADLTASAVERLRSLLTRVPGVDPSYFSPPTTQADDGDGEGGPEPDEGGGNGRGKGKGKGKGRQD